MQTGAGIHLRDLTKRFDAASAPAVDSISLDIAPGEFISLLGPSGSGKTTTLNMIGGFLEPTSGTIELNGKNISSLPPHRRNFGMVFQSYALFPHMTVFDNVAYPLKQRRVSKSEITRRVGEVLDLVDLVGKDKRYPKELSGGQQQRVALARAVVFSPEVLLLDEPLGALDRKLRQSLQAEIKRIHRELGLTFIFVTHDQEEAMSLSNRIAVFSDGKIDRVGAPDELYAAPGTEFVAQFVGESNLFRGEVGPSAYRYGDVSFALGSSTGSAGDILIVRPERLGLAIRDDEVPTTANRVQATVVDASFLGTMQRIDIALPDGARGCAILTAHRPIPVSPGDSVTAWWAPDDQAFVTPAA